MIAEPAPARPTVVVAPPLVSVVITTYNHARYLPAAIQSCLDQTYRPIEVIVVDDGSDDDPEAVVRGFPPVRYLRKPNGGLSSARNAGTRAATGSLVVFLDADDWLLPRAVEAGVAAFRRTPDAGFVAGGHRYALADGTIPAKLGVPRFPAPGPGRRPYCDFLERGNHVGMHGAVMYRRPALEGCGGFDEGLRTCEDFDVLLKVAHRFPVAYHDEVVAIYRRHEVSMSTDPLRMLRDSLAVLARQRRHCRTDHRLHAARWRGSLGLRRHYGELLLRRAITEARRGRPAAAAAALGHALRYAPVLTVARCARKLSRLRPRHLRRALRRLCRGASR